MSRPLKIIAITITSLIAIALLVVVLIYVWPSRSTYLQTGTVRSISYDESIKHYSDVVTAEKARGVLAGNTTQLLTHGSKTAKAVAMLHGVTMNPTQFSGLAKKFFDAGYNVYIPLTPEHGTANGDNHGKVTAKQLVDYANDAVTTTTGLGDEVGVIGLSGGGMLTTWAAEYRPEVKRVLMLSPFYEPAVAQAAKWQLPFLRVLYGHHVLPDTYTARAHPDDARFSYSALANYMIVEQNLKSTPTVPSLQHISLVTSASDDQIDLDLAQQIPQKIADTNNLELQATSLPADWHVGHDIVNLKNKEVAARQDTLFTLYLNSYEGRQTSL